MVSIEGATVLVTGGQRGLGRALVRGFLDRGAAKVYATARTPAADADPRVVALPLEVTDADSVTALARSATDVSIVVNNAGVSGGLPITTGDVDAMRSLFDTNVFGAIRVAQAFTPILAANGGGAHIHSALSWAAGAGAYGASKAAFWSVTNSLRAELKGQGTQVLGVHVGYVDTDMTAAVTAPKSDAAVVAAEILDALEKGAAEVLVDDVSRHYKSILAGPVELLDLSAGRG
jgi:NAD(P)-dependent dehydrogenase (short-subunit alcohol dehydrogenase family)